MMLFVETDIETSKRASNASKMMLWSKQANSQNGHCQSGVRVGLHSQVATSEILVLKDNNLLSRHSSALGNIYLYRTTEGQRMVKYWASQIQEKKMPSRHLCYHLGVETVNTAAILGLLLMKSI